MAGIERITPDNIDLNDWNVWKSIRDDTTAIFQWESPFAHQTLKQLFSDETISKIKEKIPDISYLKLFSFGNAMIRPCGASIREKACRGDFSTTGIKDIDDMLSPELNNCIIQEDIMKFVMKFCGYSLYEADVLRKCVSSDSDVLMADGSTKKIKDIVIGDRVISFDGIKYVPQNVVEVYDNGQKEVYELTAKNGFSVKATADHKFLTQDGWKELKDITNNDFIYTPEMIYTDISNTPSNKRETSYAMFLTGMLIGDGSTSSISDIHFTNSDECVIDKFKECVTKMSGKKLSTSCEFGVNVVDGKTVKNIYAIRATTKIYRDRLKKLVLKYGLNKKAKDKFIPEDFMKYPPSDKLLNLLGGLYSTDGGYNTRAMSIEYYSISSRLVNDIRNILLKFGIYSYIEKKYVPKYKYYSYVLSIKGPKYQKIFYNVVLPYIIGKKKNDFNNIITAKNNNRNSYNYVLPDKFKKEIINSYRNSGMSFYDIGGKAFKITMNGTLGIADTTAYRVSSKIYCPETYRELICNYVPQRVKNIKKVGIDSVFDIEVENTHNFVANGITVHNCIAKKKGTKDALDEIKRRFIETSSPKYQLSQKDCNRIIDPILKCIDDATRYAFSWNHSDAYSFIGYACGWLRYYYPLEFISVCLNVWQDNEEKTASIVKYAFSHKIRVLPPRFRHSRSYYYMSKSDNSVYKGVKSIKYLNEKSAEELYSLRENKYDRFVDLLYDITNKTSLESDQIEILIKLDFFSEFGNSKQLMAIYNSFIQFKKGKAKQVYKSSITNDVLKYIIERNSIESEKMYTKMDSASILNECEDYLKSSIQNDFSIIEKINYQIEYLGYPDFSTGKKEDRFRLVVIEQTPIFNKEKTKIWARRLNVISIGTGKRNELTVYEKYFSKNRLITGDIIKISPSALSMKKWNDRENWYLNSYLIDNS